jgi:hypothetical protein
VLAFLFAGPIYDLITRRRIHPAYFSVLLALCAVPPGHRAGGVNGSVAPYCRDDAMTAFNRHRVS